ncbi:ATP-binding protein [Sulfurimonas sp.]|uniref:AAA family ATPase n=1 Tax=Sulfurimonas sp. TaxID=2022749 RepID=UPI002613F522|nr:ATP-binding protein [Sulfurimonas sp.]MDD3452587.1 ATP-binding protein [Sulfurimonas sp.]
MSKREFVKTENYTKMYELLSTLIDMEGNPERIGLGYGNPGLGKTTALERLAKEFDALFVTIMESSTPSTIIKDIAEACGVSKDGKQQDVVKRIIATLIYEPRPLIVDEIDRAIRADRIGILENIRDIHDLAHIPVLFVGMDQVEAKLQRYKYLYDRIVVKKSFGATRGDDLEKFIDLCGIEDKDGFRPVKTKQDLRAYLVGKYRSVRAVKNILKLTELWCDANDVHEIDLALYRQAKIEAKRHDKV